VAPLRRARKHCPLVLVWALGFDVVVIQQPSRREAVAVADGPPQGRASACVACRDVGVLVQQTGQDFYVPVAGGPGEDDASCGVARLEVGIVPGEQDRDGGMVDAVGPVGSEETLISSD
jgi:hypothetical protein